MGKLTVWEWIALWGSGGAAVAIAAALGLDQKWTDVVVFTVIIFVCLVTAGREYWNRRAFWLSLLVAFAFHTFFYVLLVLVLPLGRFGFPKLVLIVAGMAEILLILAFLWRAMKK